MGPALPLPLSFREFPCLFGRHADSTRIQPASLNLRNTHSTTEVWNNQFPVMARDSRTEQAVGAHLTLGFLPTFPSSWGIDWDYFCHSAFLTPKFPFKSMYLAFLQTAAKRWKALFPLGSIFQSFESSGREGLVTF